MRIDKYLKVSRLVKRRTLAQQACAGGMITVNDKKAKASTEVKVGDIITIDIRGYHKKVKVVDIKDTTIKAEADSLYETIFAPDEKEA
ncbi:MAG: RNA-binding S4 domain-containing protein [Eubacteriales bacterium]